MSICIFSIVAKNYIGLAKVLRESVLKHNQVDFKIIVADELPMEFNEEGVIEAKSCLPIDSELWDNMSFKYDLTEFCTSIKPFAFKYFIKRGYKKIIYFDPDILVFDSLNLIFNQLEDHPIVLTPHQIECHTKYSGDVPEAQFLGSGVFNLGFCGINNSSKAINIVEWWAEKLAFQCYADPLRYLFTDQHWMDMIPCYLGNELCILREPGCNLAPWNYHERKVELINDTWSVSSRFSKENNLHNLYFVHFSGYNYKLLLLGDIVQTKNFAKSIYHDIDKLITYYSDTLLEHREEILKYIDLKYTYNYFSDGSNVHPIHRRMFGEMPLGSFLSPFDYTSEFYQILKKKGLIDNRKQSINNGNRTTTDMQRNDKFKKRIEMVLGFLIKPLGIHKLKKLQDAMRFYSRYENYKFLLEK